MPGNGSFRRRQHGVCAMEKSDWFRKARFGMFIHWGLYAIPGRGEWTYARDRWEKGEYEALAKRFNPTAFDPSEWARLAKGAGMKYAVLTTRHHDGFCMFDSHWTNYKITNTPYGKDVVRMYAEAFRKEGLRVGFYHSLPDWTHPGYADRESPEFIQRGELHTPTAEEHTAFRELLYHHLEQLTTEYGTIDLLFLDYTSRWKADADYFGRDRLLEMIYRNQPGILVDDRLAYFKDNVRDFDYYTPEICVPNQPQAVKGREVLWETCATMNDHWGYCRSDSNYKPLETLTAGLIGCVSKNGNLLLNVGPDETGRIPERAAELLREFGNWFSFAGEAVEGCGASEFRPPFGCVYTRKGRVLYCYFLVAPMGDVILPQLKGKIESIVLLRTGEAVPMVNDWGFELLRNDEQRVRPRGVRAGDVMKIVLIDGVDA